jgi:PAS domain S-box-containing protein
MSVSPVPVELTSAALRLIFDHSNDGILFSAPDGQIFAANAAAADILRMSAAQICRKGRSALADPTDPRWEEAVRVRAETGRARADLRMLRSDGTTFIADVSSSVFADDDGNTRACVIFRDVTNERAAAQAQQELASLQAVADVVSLHRSLTTAVSIGRGTFGIAEVVRDALHAPVVVDDLEDLSSSGFENLDDDCLAFQRWRHRPEAMHAIAFRASDWLIAIACPQGEMLGAIGVQDPDSRIGQAGVFAVEQAANVLAMELFRRRSVAEAELRVWGDLATELVESPDFARSRGHAKALGYDIDRPHRAILVQRPVPVIGLLTTTLRRSARLIGVDASLMAERAAGVVLLLAEDIEWAEFGRILNREGGEVHRIGVGGRHEASSLPQSVGEAELALRLNSADVTLFDELGVWRFLAADADPLRLAAFVEEWIGPLMEYDESHRSELVNTLFEFLRRGGALQGTAASLHVHPSTLKYRLQRIQQIAGHDLHDPDQRFNLELACRANTTSSLLRRTAVSGENSNKQEGRDQDR